MSRVLNTIAVLNGKSSLVKLNFSQAAEALNVNPCPETIHIEELKKWLTDIGEMGYDFIFISDVKDVNRPDENYSVIYEKALCAYWVIPNDENTINLLIKNLETGDSLIDTVEKLNIA